MEKESNIFTAESLKCCKNNQTPKRISSVVRVDVRFHYLQGVNGYHSAMGIYYHVLK